MVDREDYAELISALDNDGLFTSDHASDAAVIARQQRYQFRNDIQALRKISCDIRFDHHSRCYIWHDSPFGLSLTQEQLTTFSLLLNTFNETIMLHADEIKALLSYVVDQLPKSNRNN